jgi:hypothetical protein
MKQITIILLLFSMFICKAQNDTIFVNNKKIICTVKEITPDAVKFSYPNESLTNSIYKNTIKSISFGSGRVQSFNESSSFKTIKNVDDYDNVSITRVEREVSGLFKLGEVSSKAVGTTIFSNQEQVKERALKKLKIQGAFQGGNSIFIIDQRTDGSDGAFSKNKAQMNLTGVLYTTELPNYTQFKKLIAEKKQFIAVQENELKNSSFDMSQSNIDDEFIIQKIVNESGMIMIIGELDGFRKQSTFRVVSFDEEYFNIFFADKRAEYNIRVRI